MARRRRWLRLLVIAAVLVALAQVAVGLLVRTSRVHAYLISHLERSFGRQVDVRSFDATVFPALRLDVRDITVGEDPAFGNEYFLRAEKLSAGLRWKGLLRGHFEFGTLSLTRPSLILVRNTQGRWNLEDWLPPAKFASNTGEAAPSQIYGPPAAVNPSNRLQKIEFEDGRVNFKTSQDQLPFAFVAVTGAVEQVSLGRWKLQLQAQPWRSGVVLQSAGTLRVLGDVAGTSARLQPAQFDLHWSEASLADLLRLLCGEDYGVRGTFALDATAQSGGLGKAPPANAAMLGTVRAASPTDWTFSAQARLASVHRWDLTERVDNPRLTLKLEGRGNIAARALDVSNISLEAPNSNLRGTLLFADSLPQLRLDSAGIQAQDLLAWWRAFEPGVDEDLVAEQYFTGSAGAHGWPLQLDQLAFSSDGGTMKVAGLPDPLLVGAVHVGRDRGRLVLDPVRVQLGGDHFAARRRTAAPLHDAGELTASEDLFAQQGGLVFEAQVDQISSVLRAAAAFGHPINRGWELNGRALGSLQWDWHQPRGERWSGKFVVSKARVAVAGLNQELQIENAACVWERGRRSVLLGEVTGFGTTWSGAVRENRSVDVDAPSRWNFTLHGGELDAAQIDRWVGPRARPGWLQTLLDSLRASPGDRSKEPSSGNLSVVSTAPASELLRRLDAEGDLSLDRLTVEKLNFENVRVTARLNNLKLEASDIEAQLAGGKVRAKLSANFSPRPVYEIDAQIDRANLAELPVLPDISDRSSGFAGATVHLTTQGVGREELFKNLAGQGKVSLRNVEFRGWDVGASVADGAAHAGVSHWVSGSGSFALLNQQLFLDTVRLDGGKQWIFVNGTVDFARKAQLLIKTADGTRPILRTPAYGRTLKVSGPLDAPLITVDGVAARAASTGSVP